ncbi:MAG: glycogen debranching enzyme GlgX, partial [Rhodoferax sp.]
TLLAHGTPMLCAGSELGQTQGGNNNPYCQDNRITWIDWAGADTELIAYTRHVIGLRHLLLPFANHWYSGVADALGRHDIAWLNADGSPLQGDDWHDPWQRGFVCLIGTPGRSAKPLLMLFNAGRHAQTFQLPAGAWQALLDTSQACGRSDWHSRGNPACPVPAHGLLLLQAA